MPTTPDVGWICAEQSCTRVVLPAPLGPRIDPALVLLDRPVDAVEQGRTPSLDGDVGELEHGIHEWDLSGAFGIGW